LSAWGEVVEIWRIVGAEIVLFEPRAGQKVAAGPVGWPVCASKVRHKKRRNVLIFNT